MPFGMATRVKPMQPPNASRPKTVVPLVTVKLVRLMQLANALASTRVTFLPIVSFVMAEYLNASCSIVATLLGIIIFVRLLHS